MNTTTPDAARPGAMLKDDWKQLMVCAWIPAPVTHDETLYYDVLGGQLFYQYIELQLHHHGIALFDGPERQMGVAVQLSAAVAWFKVQDVAKAARAIAEGLELLAIKGFCAIAYFDTRENLWRVLWPEKPAFDPHCLFQRSPINDRAKASALVKRFSAYSKKLITDRRTPPGPGATPPQE